MKANGANGGWAEPTRALLDAAHEALTAWTDEQLREEWGKWLRGLELAEEARKIRPAVDAMM